MWETSCSVALLSKMRSNGKLQTQFPGKFLQDSPTKLYGLIDFLWHVITIYTTPQRGIERKSLKVGHDDYSRHLYLTFLRGQIR